MELHPTFIAKTDVQVCSLSGETLPGMPSWCSKDTGSSEPSLVKDEGQWQEERQADPSLMQQPLDVVGKSEVLGCPQEACADDRVCCAVLGQMLLRKLCVPK